jgi:hypothetical protein
MNNMTPEQAKAFASFAVAHLKDNENVLQEQHSQMYRWLLASLLTINGAATLALLKTSTEMNTAHLAGLFFFIVGILFAIAMAVASQKLLEIEVTRIHYKSIRWGIVLATGVIDDDIDDDPQSKQFKPSPIAVSFCSVLCFALGCLTFGISAQSERDVTQVQHSFTALTQSPQ